MSGGALYAQAPEPSYKADPSVYKIIFEDANFRVIEVNRGKGDHKAHGPGFGRTIPFRLTVMFVPAVVVRIESVSERNDLGAGAGVVR
jgi:hypothetical protein